MEAISEKIRYSLSYRIRDKARMRVAKFLRSCCTRSHRRKRRPFPRHAPHRSDVQPLRRAPRTCFRRRAESHRPALLHQFRRPQTRRGLAPVFQPGVRPIELSAGAVGTTRTGRCVESGDGVRFFSPARSGFGAWRCLELNKVRFFSLERRVSKRRFGEATAFELATLRPPQGLSKAKLGVI